MGLLTVLTSAFLSQNVDAAPGINQQLNFQGRLLNAQGATVPDGYYNIQFKIYQDGDGQSVGNTTGSPAGTLKWTESHLNTNSNGVQVKNGFLSVQLGSVTAFGSSIDWNQDTLWLSMNVGNTNGSCTPFTSCGGDGEMVPMKRMSANAYALNAGQLGGLTSAQFLQLAQGVQTDASTNTSSIFINKTSTGNLVQLQSSSVDVFTVSNSGDITFGNNANHTISVATSAASTAGRQLALSAGTGGSGTGSTGGSLLLQGGAGGGTNGNGGDVTINAGAKTGTGIDGAISIGTSNTSAVNLNQNTTLAAGKSLTITGGITASRPASPTEGMVYFDTTTDRLLTYSNGKWQADAKESVIVAASNSSQADKDAADYVGDGNTGTAADGDQVQINAALTAGSGKKVVLLAGTYVADATILVPNNTTLAGVGQGSVVQLADIDATDNLIENSDTTTGTGVTIRDLKLSGQKTAQTGTIDQHGIYLNGMGGSSGCTIGTLTGATISYVTADDFEDSGVYLNTSSGNAITNNTFSNNGTNGLTLNACASSYNSITANYAINNVNDGFYVSAGFNNVISGNASNNNVNSGLSLNSAANNNTISNNSIRSNDTYGIYVHGSNINVISNNNIRGTSTYGIYLVDWGGSGSNNNIISNNNIYDAGNSTANNAVYLDDSDDNNISGNVIGDSSATTTNHAINIFNVGSDRTQLSNNTLGTGGINDAGTSTIYGGQINASSNYLVQPAGTIELMKNTNVTGTLTVSGAITGSSTVQGTQLISTVATGTAPLTVASTTKVTNLNVDLLDGLDSTAFAASTGGTGYIQNQTASPQAAGFNINGNGTIGGTLAVTGTITGSSTIQGTSINATTGINTGGTNRIDASGNLVNIGTVTSGLINGQTISSAANFTGTIAVTGAITGSSTIQGTTLNGTTGLNTGAAGGTQRIDASGNLVNIGTITSGLINGQTISSTANFTGTVTAATSLTVPILQSAAATALLLDSGTTGALNIGTGANAKTITIGNATGATSLVLNAGSGGINLNQNTTLAAGKSLTITGGNTASRPGSPTEGMVYFDSTTDRLLTYSNGKWQADGKEAIIVAASNSSQADKDAADYVGDGNTGTAADGDQVQINAALTAGSGKKVILLAGTYVADATILVPNNTTLAGVGRGTLIELADLDATDNLIENTDQSTGTGVVLRDFRLNGRNDLNTAGNQDGIYMLNMGSSSATRTGAKMLDLWVSNFRQHGVNLNTSENSIVSGVTAHDNGNTGIFTAGSSHTTIKGNTSYDNDEGIASTSGSDYVAITANNVYSNTDVGIRTHASYGSINNNIVRGSGTVGIIWVNGSDVTINDNTVTDSGAEGIYVAESAGGSVTSNTVSNSSGASHNNGIYIDQSSTTRVTDNGITDSSATTTNYAININAASSNIYLADNTLGGSSINNASSNTVTGGQVNASGSYVIQPAGSIELMQDTNITGALTASSTIQGTRFISTVATGTAPLTVASTTLVTNLNADLLDGLSSAAFATATGAAGYIQNQNAGAQSASNFWLSGTGRADTSITTPLLDTATAVALDIGTTNATVINLNENVSIATGKTLTVVGTGLTSLGGALNVTGLSSTNGGLGVNKTLTVNGGTQNVQTITFTTAADSSGTNTASGLNITPTIGNATAGTNTANVINIGAVTGDPQVALNGLNIGALTTGNANDAALNVGTGWGNILRYNGTSLINGTGILQNAAVSGSYTGITGTGALAAGSIASGFGTIATGSTITGTTLNGTTGINTGASAGTQRIDSTGNLVNIGTITSGLINGQTISSTANFTGTVAVATSITAPILQSAAATALTVDSGTTGQLNLGTTASAKTIQIGATTGAVAQTINIGTNNTAGSTTNVTIGSGSSATAGTTAVQAKTSITIATNGVIRGTFDNANNLYLGNGVTAAAPNNFTLSGTGSSTTGVAGASLSINGGAATVGNANGGNIQLSGGVGVGTGSSGLVVIATPTFSTTSNDANCYTGGALVAASCTIAASSVNNSSAVIVGFSTATQTATLPDPSILTAGRIVYVTAANGSVDFTLSVNGGGTGNQIAMRQNTSATMIWNGADWTAAGASSSTTLQSAYDNTLQSAGGAELVVSKTASTNGLTIRESSTSPVNGTLLSVQSASAASLFSVNSDIKEYSSNSGAETTGGTSTTFPASTWSALASSTVTRHPTAGDYIATGQGSVSVVTTAVANTGVKNQMTSALTASTTYNVSFAARLLSGTFTDMNVYYSVDGTAVSVACTAAATAATSVWSKINCTFTTPSSGITSGNSIFIRQTGATARTVYIDNLSVTIAADYNFATDGNVSDSVNFATNWSYSTGIGTGVVTRNTSDGYNASDSAQVAISAGAANAGVRNRLGSNPLPDTLYRVTGYAKLASGTFTDFKIRYSPNNGTNYVDCVDYNTQTITTSGWTKVTCYIKTIATTVTTPYVYFVEGSSLARTFMVDAFSMTLRTSTTPNVQVGGGVNGGPTTLLTLDKGASAPIASDNDALLGSMYYDTTLGKLQCYEADGWGACGSSPDQVVTISPEYTNAVMHGTGIGTMTSDLCSDTLNINDGSSSQPTICGTNETYNFYKWTSPQASAQTYGIYVTYQLPSTFKEFASGQTSLMGRTDNANATVNYQIYRSDATGLTACGSAVAVSTGVQTSWQTGTASGAADPSTCTFAPGNSIVFKINTTSSTTANAYVGNLNFTFSNR